jgi:surface antigen
VQQGDVVVLPNGHAAGEVGGHVGVATGVVRSDGAIQIVQGNYGGKVAYSYEQPSKVVVRRATSKA